MYIQEKFNCCMRTMLCKEVAEGVATYDELYTRCKGGRWLAMAL